MRAGRSTVSILGSLSAARREWLVMLTCTDSPPTTQSRCLHGAHSSSYPYPERQRRKASPKNRQAVLSVVQFHPITADERWPLPQPPPTTLKRAAMALREFSEMFRTREGTYLGAGKVVPSCQDLGPTIERTSGWEGLKLNVFSWLGHVPLAVAVPLADVPAISASLCLICVWCHVGSRGRDVPVPLR